MLKNIFKTIITFVIVIVAFSFMTAEKSNAQNISSAQNIAAFSVVTAVDKTYAQTKIKVRVAWSLYVGWMPWEYAAAQGVLKKWGDKYGVEIELLERMAYGASIEAYVAKQADACVMTNMECLDMPAKAGIKSTVLIIGDYSNGNDAIITRGNLPSLKGQEVHLVQFTVSHYLLSRHLSIKGIKESNVRIMNVTDENDIPQLFSSVKVVATWKPLVTSIMQMPGAVDIFNSSSIPGEILDLMVVRTELLEKNPNIGKALIGAWYEVMDIMRKRGPAQKAAIAHMAEASGCSSVEYESQLKTTLMYWTSQSALDYFKSEELRQKMDYVRIFCFDHGLLGENAKSVDVVGIKYPDGTVQGDPNRVFMIFDSSFTEAHARGEIK